MIALFLAGFQFALMFGLLLAAGFFVQAWRHRAAPEYLLLGLATVAIAGYIGAVAGAYAIVGLGAPSANIWRVADIAVASSVVANTLLVHHALRFAAHPAERRIMSVVYPLSALILILLAAGMFWGQAPEGIGQVPVAGVDVPALKFTVTPVGAAVVAFGIASIFGMTWLFASTAWRRGEGLGEALSMGVLGLTVIHDALALGAKLFRSVGLLPLGYIVFVFSMALLLVRRYVTLAITLEDRKEELRKRSEELARSLTDLQQKQGELLRNEQLAVVGEFAAVITHEVRNPMSIVGNVVSTLRNVETVTDDTRSLLAIIEEEMNRLERLVTSLLNYARPVVPERTHHQLRPLIDSCLEPVRDMRDVHLQIECDGAWPSLTVDPDLVRQAFDNVIANALQAMDARGDITVRVTRRLVDDVDCIVIGFEDTGEGMTEDQLEQALSPFYTTRQSGAGLGLATCERIVDAHGGGMVISSELGVGTTVSVVFPARPDEGLGGVVRRTSLVPSL